MFPEVTRIGQWPVVWMPAAQGNFDDDRAGHDLVIVHATDTTEANDESAVNRFRTPGQEASTQFVLELPPGPTRFVQMVSMDGVAYGCGNYFYNQRATQFEIPNIVGTPFDPLLIDMAVALTAYLCQRDNIPVVKLSLADVRAGKRGICGHSDIPNPKRPSEGGGINGHGDPGPTFPWDDFLTRVRQTMTGETGGMASIHIPNNPFEKQVGHEIDIIGGFAAFYQKYDGMKLFGYPRDVEHDEVIDGKELRVQWFERARFERHPGAAPEDYDTLLGLLGDECLSLRARVAHDEPNIVVYEALVKIKDIIEKVGV